MVEFGQRHGNVAYIVSGLVKSYYIDKHGNETIFRFEQTGEVIGNWHSTLLEKKSEVEIEAIEETMVI